MTDIAERTYTGVIAAMDQTGDSKFMWDKDNPDEVDAARAQFDALRRKGYIAYSVKGDGKKGEVLQSFDPEAEKIIMAPAMAGG